MNYSKRNLLDEKDYVFEAATTKDFIFRWFKRLSGKATLHIYIPRSYNIQANKICKTVRQLSKRRFYLSNLISYQLDSVLKKQEIEPNLFGLKKDLTKIADRPSVEQYYKVVNTELKSVKFNISKTMLYDLEFILYNMFKEFGKHDFTVEKMAELLLLDLLNALSSGRNKTSIQGILESLEVPKEEIEIYLGERGEELLA